MNIVRLIEMLLNIVKSVYVNIYLMPFLNRVVRYKKVFFRHCFSTSL